MRTHTSPASSTLALLLACAAQAGVAEERFLLTGHVASQGPLSRRTTLARAAFSADGRFVAFVAQPAGAAIRRCQNVFLSDRLTGALTLESHSETGHPADGDSLRPSLSDTADRIAFETVASNLVGDALGLARLVVRDRRNGTLRTPRGQRGGVPDGSSGQSMLSGDGRIVIFTSSARNMVGGPDANGEQTDVYRWMLETDTVARISVDESGAQPGIGASHSPTVSRDGSLVAFVSTARLTLDDTNGFSDVYLRDLRRGTTTLVSRSAGGGAANGHSHSPALSADGRYVAFVSTASDLGIRDRNRDHDVFVYEVATSKLLLVSGTARGHAANAMSAAPAISADGRFLVYASVASNLGTARGCARMPPDTNLLSDVYLFDRLSRCTTRVSGAPDGDWWTPSVAPAIDAAGSLVAFSSTQPSGLDDDSIDFDLILWRAPPGGLAPGEEHRDRGPRRLSGGGTAGRP